MNKQLEFALKLAIALILPLLIVTAGGIFVYSSQGFFLSSDQGKATGSVSPSAMYYGITVLLALLYFTLRQGMKHLDWALILAGFIIYSIALNRLEGYSSHSVFVFVLPLVVFFIGMRYILCYVFLWPALRQIRLLSFSLIAAILFSLVFRLQFFLLKQQVESNFWQNRFLNGLMLFICLGFGLSLADYFILKLNPPPPPPPDLDED